MFSSATAEWSTPQDFFDELNKEFCFNLDPCCTHENAKCEDHYTKEDNGLEQNWGGGSYLSTLRTERRSAFGSRNRTRKVSRPVQRW